jgi:hypothetical protein
VYYRVIRTGIYTAAIVGTALLKEYSVDIEKKVCSCRFIQETEYPCRHVISFILSIKHNPYDYCIKYHYGRYLKMMYKEKDSYRPTVLADLVAFPSTRIILNNLGIEAPKIEILRGRKKGTNRIESQSKNVEVKSRKTRAPANCKYCGGNHYVKTCPRRPQ